MLDACFLGPYGENDGLLEKLVVEFLRDHVYWRRNFHPEDPPAIPTSAASHPDYQAFEARMRRELHQLSAALKKSVPFHSPRYLGHMVSDLLLPGLAAQILTLPYNPNNVSEDAAPVTVDMEVQVGLQLARMFGYPNDPARRDCAFGHLTSGGTLANYQALRLALALKAFPVVNSSLDGDDLVLKRYYNIGFAADTPNGLVVPVVRDCDRKGVLQIARETSELAAKARDGKLGPADMQGGCFSISSLGGIGGTSFTPIVNAPEVAILGVSKAAMKPVWNGSAFEPRLLLPLSLSYDHRVIDGAAAARFTAYLAQLLGDMRRVLL